MPKKIEEELTARAVRLVQEHRGEYSSLTAAAAVVAKQLGVGKETVRRWALQAEVDGGQRQGATTEELAEIKTLNGREPSAAQGRRHLAEGNNFLRQGTRPPQPLIMGFIDAMRSQGHAVESICRVLREQGCQIAARTYRSWKQASRVVAARTITDVEYATAGWVDWYNNRRLHSTLGNVPPVEYEQAHYAALNRELQPV